MNDVKRSMRGLGAAGAAGVMVLAVLSACESHPTPAEQRPDISSLQAGDKGLQSKDLVAMTDQLAPDIIQIPEIANNPNKITIVATGIDNKTSQPYVDLTIFLARLKVKLAVGSHDKVAFMEKKQTTESLQAEEGNPGQSARIVPDYALKGEFYDLPGGQTTYHNCQFQLTNIRTGQIVWQNMYEVRTLN